MANDRTLTYYAQNAEAFFAATVDKPMEEAYRRFLPLVRSGGAILDAGCGSGRDSRRFLEAGFEVTAFDASAEMARLAEAYLGRKVHTMHFMEVPWQAAFDGLWASASLLHLPFEELPPALERLAAALRPGAPFYASFKYGNGSWEKEGRFFTALNEARARALLQEVDALTLESEWNSPDNRPDRGGELWYNMLLRRR